MSSAGGKHTISPPSNDSSNEATGSILSPPNINTKEGTSGGGIQLRTSARVSKKLKLEAEAAAQSHQNQPDPKKDNTPEEKKAPAEPEKPLKRRAHELWSLDDKNTFFEALNEYGKDFDSIAKYMMGKVKKKGAVGEQLGSCKTRAQVRCFFYRTWHKIAKHLNFPEGVKKPTQELYGLINFGEMRKKCGVITVKNCIKLNELIYGGITQIRTKGKTLRIRTPNCRAMRKMNQVMDLEEDKIPNRIVVEFLPRDKTTWHTVQSMSMNPRVRTTVTNHTKLATLLNYLQKVKWKQAKGMLRVTPPSDAIISLPSVKRNESNANSHTAFSLINHEKKFGTPALVSSLVTLLNQIRHSTPGNRKRHRADSSSDKSKLSVLGGGEIASDIEKKEMGCQENSAGVLPTTGELSSDTISTITTTSTSSVSNVASTSGTNHTPTSSPNKDDQGSEHSKELPKPETVLQGWTLDSVHNTQVGHLYSMFGNEGKVVLTYCWEDVKPDVNFRATLQHMLLVAKLILNKSVSGQSCPCAHTCDRKPHLSSAESGAKSQGETFKRPKPKVEPQDEFQAQLDKLQPKSYSKRFRSKNLIVHRVHPLNSSSPLLSPLLSALLSSPLLLITTPCHQYFQS
uniref:Protein cramped-like n=1 Tax=Cacopsylla melanoneura TaxID=428564 RepID=A0A8D8Q3E4_9HEMI